MSALTANKPRILSGAVALLLYLPALPVAAATHLYAGSAVGLNIAGYLVPMSADPTLRCVGVCEEEVDNSAGVAGALNANKVRRGAWRFANNTSTEAIVAGDVGRLCYALDDDTATRTSGGGTRPALGKVVEVTSTYVLVEVGVFNDPHAECDLMVLANADLSAKQFHFVDLVNSSGTPKAASVATAGARIAGVLQNAPASGAMAILRPAGCGRQSKLIAGGVVTCGDTVASKNDGRAKTAVTGRTDTSDSGASNDALVGSYAGGIAMSTTAADGDTMYVLLAITGAIPQSPQ